MSPRLIALCLVASVACQRTATTPPPPPPPPPPSADQPPPTPPVVAQPPSADALVLTPGEGLGPYSLGMSREAVRALAGDPAAAGAGSIDVDGVLLSFEGADNALTSARVILGRAAGGVRVGSVVLQNSATYTEVVSSVGPCEAPQANRGGSVTRCQNGSVMVYQAGPTQEVSIGVARTP